MSIQGCKSWISSAGPGRTGSRLVRRFSLAVGIVTRCRSRILATVWVAVIIATASSACALDVTVSYSRAVRQQPFSGRVLLLFSRNLEEPRRGPSWFRPEPFLSKDVENWRPGEQFSISPEGDGVLTFPRDFSDVDLRGFRVQAVARFNPHTRLVGTGPGNGYSEVKEVPADSSPLSLTIDHLVPAESFVETTWTKLLRVRSKLLSDFHDREVFLQAAVVLPASYFDRPDQHYPTIFNVPGFSGTHHMGRRADPVPEQNARGVEFLRVTLDPSSPLGHHVFADSANNGPVGDALVTELIPAFDRQFRNIPEADARFLTGHSSGGWSTLWLQITYPDVFGGVWSTAPDPVDFRDFQQINLYRQGENMHLDAQGVRRPIARMNGSTVLWYDDFDWMEHVLGPGGQLHSFEAVFSPRGTDSKPERLWDRETGEINTEVARTWECYDIRLLLDRRWDELAPKLQGKLHIFMGTEDTFLLDGATRLLKESLEQLGSDAVVELHAGKDHRSLMTPALRHRVREEIVADFLSRYPDWPNIDLTTKN